MSPEMIKFLGIALVISYPFHLLKQRKEAKNLRKSLFIDYADCASTRTYWEMECRVNGEDHAAKYYPPERLVQITYVEAIDSFGFKSDMLRELKGVSLKKLKFLRALHTICVSSDEGVTEAFGAYPNHRNAFEKLREARRKFFRDLKVQKAVIDDKKQKQKQEQVEARRIDLSLKLSDKIDLLNWLTQHGPDPDFWHVLVCNTDPDGREEVYNWIARQPQCDAGTAAQIFHYSNAYEALEHRPNEFPQHLMTRYSTAKLTADRWAADNFATHRFTPNDIHSSTSYEDFKRLENEAMQKFGAPAFKISDGLFDETPREEPKTDLWFSDF